MNNKKYLKVMFGTTSGADKGLEYKIGEVNVSSNWNPKASEPKDMGGFNFSCEDKILRWLIRGDTLYDVEVPPDAEIVVVDSVTTPHGVFRTNKIILNNPRKVTDELAMDLYLKSTIPEKSYYKALAGLAIRGYINTAKRLIKDRINKNNIDLVLDEINDFVKPENSSGTAENGKECYDEILKILHSIKEEKK